MLSALRQGLMTANGPMAVDATKGLLDAGTDPKVVLESGMAQAMSDLGEKWKRGEAFLPEVVAAAEIFKKCNELVEPALIASGQGEPAHRVVIATVKGDLHDLGKNMVGAMMRTSGFEVHDLGKDVPTARIIEAVRELNPQIIGLSSLLTTTVGEQQVVINTLEKEGLRSAVKVLVGGAPVTEQWADEIGADGFAPSAPEAVNIALKLIGEAQ